MKKSLILSVAIAVAVGTSSTCFAGFGIPGIPKVAKTSKPAAQTTPAASSNQAAPVDISNITNKQAQMLKYMCGGLYAQARAYLVVDEAMGVSDPELAAAAAALKGGKNSDAKKAKSVLDKTQTKQLATIKAKEKNDIQIQKLAEAIKTGKAYQQAAIVNYGFVGANAPKAMSEATGALKNLGKNPMAINKVNGAIATYKLGLDLSAGAQKVAGEYDKMVETLKADYGVTQEALNAAKSPNVNEVANDCLNFIQGK